jgi:hypothetical protein
LAEPFRYGGAIAPERLSVVQIREKNVDVNIMGKHMSKRVGTQPPPVAPIPKPAKYVVSNTLAEKGAVWSPATIIRGDDLVQVVSDLCTQSYRRYRPGFRPGLIT